MFQKYNHTIKIGNKTISKDTKVYIIAEIGINHEGSLSRCKKLIKLAKQCNCDAVKIQLSNPKLNYSKNIKSFNLYKRSILSVLEIKKIYNYARKLNIEIFATIDESYLDLVKNLKQKVFKISSSLNRNIFFIEKISKLNLPIIISTGMSTYKEISLISNYLKKNTNNNKIIYMHAVSLYPPNLNNLNLERIKILKKKLNCIIGYSDHYPGPHAAILSVMNGAKIIEKHFTDNTQRRGYDHKISSSPIEFKFMIDQIRLYEKFLLIKKNNKDIYLDKKIVSQKRDCILNKDLKINERIKKKEISFIRTGRYKNKLEINKLLLILNKKAKRKLKKSSILRISDFKK